MAGRINVADILVKLQTVEDFEEQIKCSEEKCIIVDVHQNWCGPTTAVIPFYNSLWLEIEECSQRITPCVMELDDAGTIEAKILPMCKANGVDLKAQGCQPLFLVLRLGVCVGVVNSINTPSLRMLIDLNLPKLKKKEED